MKENDRISIEKIPMLYEVILVGFLLLLPLSVAMFFGWWHNDIFTTWRHSRLIMSLWGLFAWLLAIYYLYIRRIADMILVFIYEHKMKKSR